jgi:hypothetical protein
VEVVIGLLAEVVVVSGMYQIMEVLVVVLVVLLLEQEMVALDPVEQVAQMHCRIQVLVVEEVEAS